MRQSAWLSEAGREVVDLCRVATKKAAMATATVSQQGVGDACDNSHKLWLLAYVEELHTIRRIDNCCLALVGYQKKLFLRIHLIGGRRLG